MTPGYSSFVARSIAAERSGDADTALEFHRGVPMFARGRHLSVLTQLASLSEEMAPWMWTRWAAYQCARVEDQDPGRTIQRRAVEYTVAMFYADRVERAYVEGEDLIQLLAHVTGESWLCQQLCTFELGGLSSFVEKLATGRLREEMGLARSWGEAWMGGYRVLRSEAGSLLVQELGRDRELTLLDLGAALQTEIGGCLIGRVVPSGTTPELMFDTRPIAVDERTACEVASSMTRGGWVSAVKSAIADGRLSREQFESEDLELASDVPALKLLEAGTPTAALASTLESLSRGRDEVGRASYRILSRVADGSFGPDAWAPYVAAAVLYPHGYAEALRLLSGTGRPETWARWGALVAEPARSRLLRLAGLAAAA